MVCLHNDRNHFKNRNLRTGLMGACLLVLLFPQLHCTKKFDGINNDDTRVTEEQYKAEYSLTRAQLEYTGNSDYSYETWRVNIIYCGMMMQQLANTTWYAGDKYTRNDGWSASYFEVAYRDQVRFIVDMLELTRNNPALHNLHQVGRIMKVLIFHRITDLYGDVPYKQAGLGYHEGIPTPRYDPQDSIYLDMLKELDEALASLDGSLPMPGAADLLYGKTNSSYDKWKRFGYSLMLRLALRMVKRDAQLAKEWVVKAKSGGLMLSNDDNAWVQHDLKGGRATVNRNSNILSGEWNATGWNRASNAKTEVFLSQTLVDCLKQQHDPRLGWMAQVRLDGNTDPAAQIGMPNGYNQSNNAFDISLAPGYPGAIENYSTIRGDIWLKLDGPTVILSYAQVEFMLAEAVARGWLPGSVSDHYYRGVKAAMQQLSQYDPLAAISETSISEFLSQHPLDEANPMPAIQQQYWITCFLDWYEAWSNWRRTGLPALVPVVYPGNATQGQIPRRMLYPASEASVNAENYSQAIRRQGANEFMTRVWWDKN